MKKIILGLIILSIIFIVGCSGATEDTTNEVPAPGNEDVEEKVVVDDSSGDDDSAGEVMEKKEFVVEAGSSGFSPSTLTIKKGDTVKFVGQGTDSHWPASAVHPIHNKYPGSGLKKCSSGERIFDACKGLLGDEEFSFQFDEVGEWKYHDHLNPGLKGTIIVE